MLQPPPGGGFAPPPYGMGPVGLTLPQYGMGDAIPAPYDDSAQREYQDDAYSLPTDEDDARALADDAIGLWGRRDRRMALDERAWMIPEPHKPNRMQLSDCHAQAEAAGQLMARAPMQIRGIAHDDPSKLPAQATENWCRAVWSMLEKTHAAKGLGEWRNNLCWSLNVRGWLVLRTLFNPGDYKWPFAIALLDPLETYPADREDFECCVIHRYHCSLKDLRREWGRQVDDALNISPAAQGRPDGPTYEVTAFYTPTQFAVLCQGEWLKKPVAHYYGFNPIGIFLASGLPFRQEATATRALRHEDPADPNDWDVDAVDRYIGTSFLHAIRVSERDNQNIANLEMELLRGAARPPSVVFVQNPDEINEVPQEPNSTAVLRQGEQYGRYPPDGSALQFAVQMRQQGQGNVYQTGLTQPLMGDMSAGNAQSGFHEALLGAAGARALAPRVATVGRASVWLLESCMRLFSRFGGQPMPYLVRDRDSGAMAVQKMAPWLLQDADYAITVDFGEMGYQNTVAMGTLAGTLVDRGIISVEYALEELLRVENPMKVRKEALEDQRLKDPRVMQLMMWAKGAKDPSDPELQAISQLMLQMTLTQFLQQIQQAMSPPPPPGGAPTAPGGSPPPPGGGPPPLPGSGTPSAPTPGLPNAILPDELGGAAGLLPNAGLPPGVAPPGAGLPGLVR